MAGKHTRGMQIDSVEAALRILETTPQGWQGYKRLPEAKFRFEHVPPRYRPDAHLRLQLLIERWQLAHPGQTISSYKLRSLIGNVTCYYRSGINKHSISLCGHAWRQRSKAREYLAARSLDSFKSQPLNRRMKRLSLG